LEAWNLYSHYFLYDSWDLYNFLNNSWYWDDLFNYSLNLDNSGDLNDLFYDSIHKHSFNLDDFFFNNNRNRYLNSNFLYDFFSDRYNPCNFLVNNFWLRLNIRHLHLNINWFLFLEIQRYDLFNLNLLSNEELFSVRFLDNDFNLFDDFLSVTLDEMSHLNNNFLLNFFHDFFFLNNRNFDNFLLNNSIWNNFLNDFSNIDFSLFSVSDKSWYFSV